MTQEATGYIMMGNESSAELRRLRGLELILDPNTEALLTRCPDLLGRKCLEVGAGAGSVTTHLLSLVGSDGDVLAVDIDTTFLDEQAGYGILKSDINSLSESFDGSFDLVHARAVIEHTVEPEQTLMRVSRLVRPGGSLLVEALVVPGENIVAEDDPVGPARKAVHDRMTGLGTDSGIDFLFGYRVPWLLGSYGLEVLHSEIHGTIFQGGDERADFYRISFDYLKDLFLADGTVTSESLNSYVESASTADHFQQGPLILATLASRSLDRSWGS
ncbi:MAG: class I SAM-dependent methyltransferase [Acidimicrobiales bacterium]